MKFKEKELALIPVEISLAEMGALAVLIGETSHAQRANLGVSERENETLSNLYSDIDNFLVGLYERAGT